LKPTIKATIEKLEELWTGECDPALPTVMDGENDPAVRLTTYGWKQARKIIQELLDSRKN
jgi:hypothetical protein